jgi:hypothetical protein
MSTQDDAVTPPDPNLRPWWEMEEGWAEEEYQAPPDEEQGDGGVFGFYYTEESARTYNRVEDAARGGYPCDQFDLHNYLCLYGTSQDIIRHIQRLLWAYRWLGADTRVKRSDAAALRGVGVALDRAEHIYETARWAESELAKIGWRFDPKDRTLKEIKQAGPDGKRRRGRPVEFVSDAIVQAYHLLTDDRGWPKKHTVELEEEIYRVLEISFPPEILTRKRIHSVVNDYRNKGRHPRSR